MKLPRFFQLVSAVILCQLAGVFGSLFTVPAISTWYVTLRKPSITPPDWLFGPVWFILYTLIGIVLFMLWKKRSDVKSKKKRHALQYLTLFFYIHLVLNASWSMVFFGLKNIPAGLVIIALVWGTAGFLLLRFERLEKPIGWLFLPYFLWVSYATILTILILWLNPLY